jgi:hypothetical protein
LASLSDQLEVRPNILCKQQRIALKNVLGSGESSGCIDCKERIICANRLSTIRRVPEALNAYPDDKLEEVIELIARKRFIQAIKALRMDEIFISLMAAKHLAEHLRFDYELLEENCSKHEWEWLAIGTPYEKHPLPRCLHCGAFKLPDEWDAS